MVAVVAGVRVRTSLDAHIRGCGAVGQRVPSVGCVFVELFCGSGVLSREFGRDGWVVHSFDNNPAVRPGVVADVLDVNFRVPRCDVLWASPPCTAFSVASIGRHWGGGFRAYLPKSERAVLGLRLLDRTVELIALKIKENPGLVWFVENPRGVMRKVIDKVFLKYGVVGVVRHTVTYCQYGDSRMKPTDLWSNCKEWVPRPACKNGALCHVRAPRGARTGTQGLAGAFERGILPGELCGEIVGVCSQHIKA